MNSNKEQERPDNSSVSISKKTLKLIIEALDNDIRWMNVVIGLGRREYFNSEGKRRAENNKQSLNDLRDELWSKL